MKTLYIKNRVFSMDELDLVLKSCLPGKYKIVWFTKSSTWEMQVNYNGKEFVDLY